MGDPNQRDGFISPRQFYSPTLGEQMQSRGSFDFTENDMGSPIIAGGGSNVYSPFLLQLSYADKTPSDAMKNYSGSFEVGKTSGIVLCFW